MALFRGVRNVLSNQNRGEIGKLARFAVDEHNKKSWLKKLYEAKGWGKPLLNFKELHEFKPTGSANLGCKKDEHGSGWREVPGDDPEVQHVAKFVTNYMTMISNCIFPYELQEVVHANAEVTGEAVKFNMLLKWNLGDMEQKLKVEVHKNHEGALKLNHFEKHHG